MLEDYLTVEEAAVALNVEYKTLLARIAHGRVKAERKGKRILLIHKDEIKRCKQERTES